MAQPLVILGTGGSAYDVLDIVDAINRAVPAWHVAGFLDDMKLVGSTHLGLPVLGRIADARTLPAGHRFVNVIGSDVSFRNRPQIIAQAGLDADRFATLVHPLASVSSHATVGRGVYVACGASIGGGVKIGDWASISPGVIVGHDTAIGKFALLAPGAVISGFCDVGSASYIGARAALRQRVRVGEKALVGMGSVVLHDVEPGTTVVGSPARLLHGNPAAIASRGRLADPVLATGEISR
ncbi:MAG TPA: NeuD/PglB/VioB family sugar acetyltransferase [Tepidisphaeraceae bacterium]|nr:NeuD/PglB/VioB family sugar acetyltransferase [Tepidisphaeraceae bacterium]